MVLPVQFVNAQLALPVNLIPRRTLVRTLGTMLHEEPRLAHVLQAEFAYVQRLGMVVRRREGGVVPRLHQVLPHDDLGNVLDLGYLVVFGLELCEVGIARVAVPIAPAEQRVGRVRIGLACRVLARAIEGRIGGWIAGTTASRSIPPAEFAIGRTAGGAPPIVLASRVAFFFGRGDALEGGEVEAGEGDPFVETAIVFFVVDVVEEIPCREFGWLLFLLLLTVAGGGGGLL
mmetsp:Transcript_5209/g.8195  ORF Transcript_5209/g.8195 Transcript_5209/m.8195 type:complete len:231 (+) Transcript_5209:852-1544(+)